MIIGLIYLVSYLLLTVLPSFVVAMLSKRKLKVSQWWLYPFLISLFSLVGFFFWETFVFNNFYYEWDRTLLPFTLFYHESPVLDVGISSGSWIKPGWSQIGLDSVWLGMVVIITIGVRAVLQSRFQTKEGKHYLFLVSRAMVLLSIGLTVVFRGLEFFNFIFS